MSTAGQQQIIIYSASEEKLIRVKEFIRREIIHFGKQAVRFVFYDKPPRLISTNIDELYLKEGRPWCYPFNRVIQKFPSVRIMVDYHDGKELKQSSYNGSEAQLKESGDKQKGESYFKEIQRRNDEKPIVQNVIPQTISNLELPPVPSQIGSQGTQTNSPYATQSVTESAGRPKHQIDSAGNEIAILQKQLVDAKENTEEAEICVIQAEERARNAEQLLKEERQKREKIEQELKKAEKERKTIEQLKQEVEQQKEEAERRAKKAEVNATYAEEEIVKERFMSSVLAIKAQLTEQNPISQGAANDSTGGQNINSLSRIANLIRQDKNAGGMNAFHKAAKTGSFSEFSVDELNEGNLLMRDDEGNTTLHWAAAKGNLALIPGHLLTAHNLLLKNNHRATCLHLAALGGCLMDMPADILTMDNILSETDTGCNCLHLAAIEGRLAEIPDQLFTHEALNMKNRNGQTPIEVADAGGHKGKVPGELRALAIDPNVSVAGNLTRFKESLREMRWKV
tara:strand:+ start:139 stop:1668 length:1530 start_codon:yes stop_codon:yes gene_type:complete